MEGARGSRASMRKTRIPCRACHEKTTPDTPKGHLKTREYPYRLSSSSANEAFTVAVNALAVQDAE